jgi:MFS family permease
MGFSETSIMPAMSLGQATEVLAMGFLGLLIARFGPRRLLAAGILMEIGRFALFAVGTSPVWLYIGLGLHGPAFAFFFATGFIILDSYCDSRSRAGVHQLFAILTSGLGSLAGNLAAGRTLDFIAGGARGPIDFQSFWLVPTLLACLALALAWGYARSG